MGATRAVTWPELPPALKALLLTIREDGRRESSPGDPKGLRVALRPWLGADGAGRQRCRRALIELEGLGLIELVRERESGRAAALELTALAVELLDTAKRERPQQQIESHETVRLICPVCEAAVRVPMNMLRFRCGHCRVALRREGNSVLLDEDQPCQAAGSGIKPGTCPACGCAGSELAGLRRRVGDRVYSRRRCLACAALFTIVESLIPGAENRGKRHGLQSDLSK